MIRPVFASTAFVPTRARFVLRGGHGPVRLPVRCGLIVHPQHGPVLIDAGYGPRVTQAVGRSLMLRAYAAVLPIQLNPQQSPLALLAAHGFAPHDVRRVIVTHLHADHVAYLRDFPNARFVTDGVTSGRVRNGVFDELLPDDFAPRQDDMREASLANLPFDMGQGYDVFGDGRVLAVPLPGHASGHFGLCFLGDQPLLYAVDVQWMMDAVMASRSPGFPLSLVAENAREAAQSTRFVRQFTQAGGTVVLCHDPASTPFDWTPDV